jgi:asparagine synthase (glutamine-hydrolysing)
MCGIAGIVHEESARACPEVGEKMAAAISHRGPDSSGVERLGSCVLVNTRLAIVDLSERGKQPMPNGDRTAWITYNGECYNAAELRERLVALGHRFSSTTDTEVVLHMYEEFGDQFVKELRGMYAFAIWDSRKQKLLLARDRLGIKPLYYAFVPHGLVFGSEIKALLASGLVARKLDGHGVRAYLQLGHVPPPWTALREIRPLEPGEMGIWQNAQFRRSHYWTVPTQTKQAAQVEKRGAQVETRATNSLPKTPDAQAAAGQAAAELAQTLIEASRLQLMSDVPIALFLSGGVDSAVIGALMRRAGAGDLTALTIGFEEEHFDESEASRRTAERLGIPHRVLRLPATEMAASLDHAIWAMDQPTVDGMNAYWVCRAAAEAGCKVALSGQGGDELFGGYESVGWFERFSRVAKWMKPLPHGAFDALLDRPALPFRARKLSYLFGADDPFVAAQLAVKVLFLESDVHTLLNPELSSESQESEAEEHLTYWAKQVNGAGLRDKVAYMDIETHLLPRLLRDGDAMSMAHSLEVRPVFLDHKVVEQVLALPASIRLQKKRLLLAATRELCPDGLYEELVSRPKRTFTFPFTRWLAGDLRATVEETFQAERLRRIGLLNPEAVASLWRKYLQSPASVGWSRIWSLFVLQRWCETMNVGP